MILMKHHIAPTFSNDDPNNLFSRFTAAREEEGSMLPWIYPPPHAPSHQRGIRGHAAVDGS